MANTKNKQGRRRSNPLTRGKARVPRPMAGFNGQVLNSRTYSGVMQVGSAGTTDSQIRYFDCGDEGVANNTTIPALYKEYKYRSVRCEWLPSVGPASALANGQMTLAFESNPEQMVVIKAASHGARLTAAQNDATVRSFNLWERASFNVPLVHRRKLFDVNSNTDETNVDVLNRSTQGMFYCVATVPGAPGVDTQIGRWIFTYSVELHGLSNVAT